MKLSNYTLVIVMLCLSFLGYGQHPAFINYRVEQGLPSDEVHDIEIDDQGFVWFATDRGVSKYDGYSFQNFSVKDGLADNTIFEIIKDYRGRLWFVGYSAMLSIYENGKIRPYQFNHKLKERLSTQSLFQDFFVDSLDNIYYTLKNAASFGIDQEGNFFEPLPLNKGLPDLVFKSYYQHKLLDIRLGSEMLDEIAIIRLKDTTRISRKIGDRNYSWNVRPGEWLLAVNSTMLKKITSDTVETIFDFAKNVYGVMSDDKHYWVATSNGIKQATIDQHSTANDWKTLLPGKFVTSIATDMEGGEWASTLYNGIYYFPNTEVKSFTKSTGLTFDYVTTIAVDSSENIFIGGKDGEINIIRKEGGVISYSAYKKKQAIVNQFQLLNKGKMFFTSGRECIHVIDNLKQPQPICSDDYVTVEVKQENNKVKYLNRHPKGNYKRVLRSYDGNDLLLVGNGVISIYREAEQKIFQWGPNKRMRIISAFPESANTTLLGTLRGLYRYENGSHDFISLANENIAYSNRIKDMLKVSDSVLVMATEEAGILLQIGDSIHKILPEDGLNSYSINDIDIVGNTIWAGSDRGLNQIELILIHPLKYNINTYNVRNGLISDFITELEATDSHVYVATKKGISVLAIDELRKKAIPPYIQTTAVKINGVDSNLSRQYLLQHDQNKLQFFYTGISYQSGNELNYKYRLYGLDDQWTHTTNRQIQYTALPHGNYRFEVFAQNKDGFWSAEPAVVQFAIKAPFWLRWWFILLAIMVGIGLVTLIIVLRTNAVKKKTLEKERITREKIELELKALRAQMNPHFIFNALNAIKNFIMTNDTKASDRFLTDYARFIRLILQNSRKSAILLQDEISLLQYYLELEKVRFNACFDYQIDIDPTINLEMQEVPPMSIYPYVENAVLQGVSSMKAGGRIEISFNLTGQYLCCTVKDNGISTKKIAIGEDKSRSLGMIIARQRLAMEHIDSDFQFKVDVKEIVNKQGEKLGTKVDLHLPFEQF